VAILNVIARNTFDGLSAGSATQTQNANPQNNVKKIIEIVQTIFSVGRNVNAVIKDFLEIIKKDYVEKPDTKKMEIYRLFAELEINIKTAQDAAAMFEGTCLLCTTIQ